MAGLSLIEFIDKDKSFRDQLTSKQVMAVRRWAQKIKLVHRKGYLECLREFDGERLQTYLENLIPDYPAGDE